MTRKELIQKLIDHDGAILYWQLPREPVEALIAEGLAYIADDDCLVHADAVKIGEGAYMMPKQPCQHRSDGRGFCIDCGAVYTPWENEQ